MFEIIKKWLEDNRDFGISFWYAYDPTTQKASVTLFMAYTSFILSIIAGIYSLIKPGSLLSVISIYAFNVILVILYMMHKINKAKFDLDDRSFEIENTEKEEKK